jgi:hypothetical protein
MASIEVDALGLSALAGLCEEKALRVGLSSTSSFSGSGHQPSAAAVRAAYVDVDSARVRLAARMQSTAAAASTAAVAYGNTEVESAADIATVAAASVTAV